MPQAQDQEDEKPGDKECPLDYHIGDKNGGFLVNEAKQVEQVMKIKPVKAYWSTDNLQFRVALNALIINKLRINS